MNSIDHYPLGRAAAEAGQPPASSGLQVGTVAHRDWKRGYEDWHEEQNLTDTVPGSELAQELARINAAKELDELEICGTGDA